MSEASAITVATHDRESDQHTTSWVKPEVVRLDLETAQQTG